LIESDIQQISGINHPVGVNLSGAGNPAYRICNNSDCTSVKSGWKTGRGFIKNGEYLQLRQTSSSDYTRNIDAQTIV